MRRALVFVSLALLAGCIDPADRRPGLWLSGEPVAGPVADWSFANEPREVFLEVRTPYLLRHSVTIVCAAGDGVLYVGARNPETKRWVRWVERDPAVRLGIDGRLYEGRLEPIADEDGRAWARAAYAAKYGRDMEQEGAPPVQYFRVLPPG